MTPGTEELRALLAELRQLVPADDIPDVDELARRLDQQALRVVVAGEAKRGKSTLVNALLGREVVPSGVVPLTAVTTTIRYGPVEQVVARRCWPADWNWWTPPGSAASTRTTRPRR